MNDQISAANGPWTRERFLQEAVAWLPDLAREAPLEAVRQATLERVNRLHFETYSGDQSLHDLDLIVVRDCARAWRGLLHPRSERLAGLSVLQALVDTARGAARDDLAPGFWAEVCHLVRGIEGRERLHSADSLEMPPGLAGRDAARHRSLELDRLGRELDARIGRYEHGLAPAALERRASRARDVQRALGATPRQWSDWRWQVRHVARTSAELARVAPLSADERAAIDRAEAGKVPFGVTPYYASLLDAALDGGRDRALRAQVIPPADYLDVLCSAEARVAHDFMQEADTSPADLVTRRYAGVAILKPYNTCPQICVYCQRNWEIEAPMARGAMARPDVLSAAIAWLGDHPAIHDVLVTGGDPLVLSDSRLEALLDRLAAIPHVERIRIGSRTPVTLPMRFTPALARLLGSYRQPGRRELCLVTHVEHPYEITPELVAAVDRLRRRGISVYNQLVFTFHVSRRFEAAALRRLLRRCGLDPYYTFNAKGKEETASYRVPIARLVQEQKEEARLMPGLTRTDEPVFNVPGLGKNPLNAWQHRDLISIAPDGSRLYEFHPWEKKIAPQRTYVARDVPILSYLRRLEAIGEDLAEYRGIWYYF
ncbi:MAG TPA: KamA family radical SAM protein [Myxococcota bacterium]|nr:KamA family radical SAM protein [Myxococcota bacterium]HRY92488.1 KamA family radical SAM protein [Myxococcota bacterium]HSA22630.1 KamA family radical SAM protein [Myxococcota bacterium]